MKPESKTKKNIGKVIASGILVIAVAASIFGLSSKKQDALSAEDIKAPYVIEECIDFPPAPEETLAEDEKEKSEKKNKKLAGIIAAIAAALKKVFPAIFLKKMLSGKRLLWILVLIIVIIAICEFFVHYDLRNLNDPILK